jgi:CelD/BcsL family acetyltransferase involved in cellulose biosynthesis
MGMRPVPEEAWWEVAAACPEATFFHTPLWSRLVTAAFPGWRDASMGFTVRGGQRAVLPMVEAARPMRGLFRELVSTFAGCYGGLIAEPGADPAELAGVWESVLGQGRLARLELTGSPVGAAVLPSAPASSEDVTHLLDLTAGYESLVRGYSESTRRAVRKARAAGVTVERATREEDFRAYFEVYEDALRRWAESASNHYPWELFAAGFALGRTRPGVMELWLARLGERVVAGAWVFSWNGHVDYWHGATREEALPASPGHLLHDTILQDACARGARYYDFNPSGGHPGAARFKSGFGAQRRPVPRYVIPGRLFPAAQAVARTLRG